MLEYIGYSFINNINLSLFRSPLSITYSQTDVSCEYFNLQSFLVIESLWHIPQGVATSFLSTLAVQMNQKHLVQDEVWNRSREVNDHQERPCFVYTVQWYILALHIL